MAHLPAAREHLVTAVANKQTNKIKTPNKTPKPETNQNQKANQIISSVLRFKVWHFQCRKITGVLFQDAWHLVHFKAEVQDSPYLVARWRSFCSEWNTLHWLGPFSNLSSLVTNWLLKRSVLFNTIYENIVHSWTDLQNYISQLQMKNFLFKSNSV